MLALLSAGCLSSPVDSGAAEVPLSCAAPVEQAGSYIWTGEDPGLICDGVAGMVLTGWLTITETADASGLSCLCAVDKDVTVTLNADLVDLSGLENLQRIGGKLVITENEALARVTDMTSLSFVGEKVRITDNPSLPTADAERLVYEMIGLGNIGDSVSISGNADR